MIDCPDPRSRMRMTSAICEEEWRQNRKSEKTLKRDDPRAGRLRKDCELGWITLKGKKAEERRLVCLTETRALIPCPVRSRRAGRDGYDWRQADNRIGLKSTNRGAEMQRTGPIRRP
jgi:hypothetical protein